MAIYLIKSTLSLGIFYLFYHFFLRNCKVFSFNRFYLIISLAFSLSIPLIQVPIKIPDPVLSSINELDFIQSSKVQDGETQNNKSLAFLPQNILLIFLIAVSAFLFARFVLNVSKLIIKITGSERIKNQIFTLVLVDEKITPHSFLKFIFLSRTDFENGKIERELIVHEEAHCEQNHSIDILILELIHIFLWFNPLIWLYRKAILLNHEYYADARVLSKLNSLEYPNLLVKLVLQNNSSYLVSNFKHSLIKNRLIMMTNDRPLHRLIFRKISAFFLFLAIGITLSFSQRSSFSEQSKVTSIQDPIIERANTSTILSDKILILSGNVIIRIPKSDTYYYLIKTENATYDKEKKLISAVDGTMERFSLERNDLIDMISFDSLKYDVASNRAVASNISGKVPRP